MQLQLKYNIEFVFVLFQLRNIISTLESIMNLNLQYKFSDNQNITSSVSVGPQVPGSLDPVSGAERLINAVTGVADVDHGACITKNYNQESWT